MDAIEFIEKYPIYIEEIKNVIRPELHHILDELAQIDPHDLVQPDTWLPNENHGRGLVWSLFLKKVRTLYIDKPPIEV